MKKFDFKTILKITVVIFFTGFIGLQFVPKNFNQSREILPTDMTKTLKVPNDVQNVLKTSCYDCHSNNTKYPWYNRIQPAAWFMEGHITDGKKQLNFSEFGDYSKRRQRTKLRSISSQIKSDEMPLPSYLWIHWDAKLTPQEKKLIEEWARSLQDNL